MKYLPIFTDVRGMPILIVGGGPVALRKARLLDQAGAQLTLISPTFHLEIEQLAVKQGHVLVKGCFSPEQVDGQMLVIAATDSDSVNESVAVAAKAANIPVNVVDSPDNGSFIFPAIVDRSPIVVAISSGGDAPVLVRRLREKLETLLPQHLGPLAELMGRFRAKVKRSFDSINARRYFWEKVLSSPVVSLLGQQRAEEAEQALDSAIDSAAAPGTDTQGEVYIVGGGPGDPDLLTLKALQLMQQADVIVHDGLVSEEVLNLCRRDADRVSVSKSAGCHSVPQDGINQLLVDYARQGRKVCRLKGGDPFIFGRGGEEAEVLAEAGIPFQIVPGITAAAGCSAYSGIPLTHRDYAQGVQFVTGHTRKGGKGPDWRALAQANQTQVFYMGLINAKEIVNKLTLYGRDGNTPVALVERGTTSKQRVITGTLSGLVELIAQHQVKSPALIIVGEVVELRQKLNWFGHSGRACAFEQPLVQLETRSAA